MEATAKGRTLEGLAEFACSVVSSMVRDEGGELLNAQDNLARLSQRLEAVEAQKRARDAWITEMGLALRSCLSYLSTHDGPIASAVRVKIDAALKGN